MMSVQHKILIVGGGFGGVKVAQDLAKSSLHNYSVQLVDPKSFMEYHAASYRLVTGRSPMEVCLPYRDLFEGLHVQVDQDAISSIDTHSKSAVGTSGTVYSYDTLVLALGGKPETYGIPGITEYSFNVHSSSHALKLKRHIHTLFEEVFDRTNLSKVPRLHVVVVGGGATGVELSAELAHYSLILARNHGVDASLCTIDLIEAGSRILASFPDKLQKKVEKRLRSLGVNILLNRTITSVDAQGIHLTDADIATKTVIWTAGMRGAELTSHIDGLLTDKKGRAVVTDTLQASGHKDVYVIGDSASTKYSGMAQTALSDAVHVARSIVSTLSGRALPHYIQPAPSYAVPVGQSWSAVIYHGWTFTGRIGWMMRRVADLRAFLALLPLRKALRAFIAGHTCTESCSVCARESVS